MFVPPYDVACQCCKAKRGNVCRSRITRKPLRHDGRPVCHELRWTAHFKAERGRAPGVLA